MAIDIRMTQVGGLFSEGFEAGAPLSPREKRARRDVLFEERLLSALRRRVRAAARALRPDHIASLPAGIDFVLREKAIKPAGLPDPAMALTRPDGLCGIVDDADPSLVMDGFARGLFPAADIGPLKYWSPAIRQALRPANCKLPRAVKRLLRTEDLQISLDADFDDTIATHAHGAHGWRSGRLLSPRALNLLAALADLGYAHSIDVDDSGGRHVAGAFGVAVGRAFVTLGAFGQDIDHADAALVVLNRHLSEKGILLHDFVGEADVERLGFAPMPRADYLAFLAANPGFGRAGGWRTNPDLCGRVAPHPSATLAAHPAVADGKVDEDDFVAEAASIAA